MSRAGGEKEEDDDQEEAEGRMVVHLQGIPKSEGNSNRCSEDFRK